MSLNELRDECHTIAKDHGWHDTPKSVGDDIALMHSELSEALEEHRSGHMPDRVYYGKDHKPEGVPIELADCIIRIMDFCGLHDIDIEDAVYAKMAYNRTRPYRHGNKAL